jgi:hypothetical protein
MKAEKAKEAEAKAKTAKRRRRKAKAGTAAPERTPEEKPEAEQKPPTGPE